MKPEKIVFKAEIFLILFGILGFSVIGLQNGQTCFCGNSFGRYSEVSDEECSMPCTGMTTERCGGAFRNSVYQLEDQTRRCFFCFYGPCIYNCVLS